MAFSTRQASHRLAKSVLRLSSKITKDKTLDALHRAVVSFKRVYHLCGSGALGISDNLENIAIIR